MKIIKQPRLGARKFTVPGFVALQAVKTPCAVAIVDDATSLTYAELEGRADALARYLRFLGARRDTVVGLCVARSVAHIVGALAIMKAGAAYLPLDPELPEDRLLSLLHNAGTEIVLRLLDVNSAAPLGGLRLVPLHPDGRVEYDETDELDACDPLDACEPLDVDLTDLAYVIYTSGSAGEPKGVEITHGGLANLVAWHNSTFLVQPSDRASSLSPVGFDAAVWEVWPYLSEGASVRIAGAGVAREARALRDWLVAHAITISFVSTPIAERLIDLDFPAQTALRVLLTGADTLHRYPAPTLPFLLFNNYGPTEATVVATSGLVAPREGASLGLPSIGRPIANTQIYLLDASGARVADGGTGEICIAGVGLARGYRGLPELTAERFQWCVFDGEPAIRVYRTGDRGRRLADGEIAFLGRVDDQVKIRGFRVEPREIETRLNAHAGVRESAVVVREFAPGDERLVAYVIPRPGHDLVPENIQSALAARLPPYMVPTMFVEIDALPLTANGKIDRVDLRARDVGARLGSEAFVPPRSLTEERLMQIIAGLLQLERVSVDDDFFLLGGHSLLGTQLIARLRDAFDVRIGLRFVFESPTIRALAQEVDRQLRERLTAAEDISHTRERIPNLTNAPIRRRRA